MALAAERKTATGQDLQSFLRFLEEHYPDEVIHVYLGTGLTAGRQQLDRDEVLEVVEMPITKAVEMIHSGEIRDAKTIVGLQSTYILLTTSSTGDREGGLDKEAP